MIPREIWDLLTDGWRQNVWAVQDFFVTRFYRLLHCTRHGHRPKMDVDYCVNCGKDLK